MPLKQIKNSYNAGELSDYMDGRTDINKYYNGASVMINALVLPHGGFTKRPGTEYKATAAGRANLTPFEFSVDDALVLEWTNLLLRFYKDQAIVTGLTGEVTASYPQQASLKAHWKLNERSGTNIIDSKGSHDGTCSVDVSGISVVGKIGRAIDFANQYYITITDHADFEFPDTAFSIAAWVYVASSAENQEIITKADTAGNDEWFFQINSEEKPSLSLYDDANNKWSLRPADTALTVNNWYYIVVTYDGREGADAADGITIYVDGSVVASTANNDAAYVKMVASTADIVIGSTEAHSTHIKDKLDNIAVWKGVELSSAEVTALYALQTGTGAYSIVSPYTTAQSFGIHYTQSADVMYIAHEDVHPKKLSRYGATDWEIIDVPFKGGPFLDENTTAASLVGFARTGGTARSEYYFLADTTGTLTATAHAPFNSDMVGTLWLVKHTRDVDNDTDTFAKDTNVVPTETTYASGAIYIKGDATATFGTFVAGDMAQLWRKEGNGNWQTYRSFRAAAAFSWNEDADDVMYAMTRSVNTILGTLSAKEQINYGIVEITAFTSSTVVTVKVIDKVLSNNSNDNAVTTSMWAEGAWSTYRGFPRTVGFHEDRLWWASSTNNPDRLWTSKSGLYEDMSFSNLGLDNEAVTVDLRGNEVSQVQWMMSKQVMAIGAANREYRLSAANPDDPITPLDKKSIPQTGFSSGDIQPVMLNDSIFFLQRQGKKLGAMKFDSVTENFVVDDATLLAYGLLDFAPTNMAVSRSPDSTIWVVRTDGIMPTFTYEPKEEVAGWARQIFGNSAAVETPTGYVESSAVIHGTTEDEIWVCVRRVINTATVYYIEKFKPRSWGTDIEDACFVDSAVTYDGGLVSTVTCAHLKGETVDVFADGVVFDTAVANVSTGVVTLLKDTVATQASVVQVGLPYTMKVRSMRLAVPQAPSALQAKIKRVTSVTVRYIRSLLGSAGTEYGGTEYLTDIEATYSTASADTDEQNRATEGGFNEDAYVVIISEDPVPFTGLAAVVDVEI